MRPKSFIDIYNMNVTVQDGGNIDIKNCVKLACKQIFISIFTSDEHPMLLDRPFGQEDEPS